MQTHKKALGPIPSLVDLCDAPENAPHMLSSWANASAVAKEDTELDKDKFLEEMIREQALALQGPTGSRPSLPGRSSVEITPADMTQRDVRLLDSLRLINQYIGSSALTLTARLAPDGGWKISDPASAAELIKTQANVTDQVIRTGMRTLMSSADGEAGGLTKSSGSMQLNVKLITDMFAAFAFPETQALKLQSALKTIGSSLQDVNVSWKSDKQTLDHCVNCYYVGEVQGMPGFRVGYYRNFYMHIGKSSYKAKCENVFDFSKQDFDIHWYDAIYEVHENEVAKRRESIEKVLDSMGANSMEAMKKLLEPVAKVQESAKSETS